MSDSKTWPLWHCSASASSWTVGSRLNLTCQGGAIEKMASGVHFEFPADRPELEYSLAILSVSILEAEKAEFVITGYKPGKFSGIELTVSDGSRGFRVNDLQWTVESVIDPQDPPQQPFGPYGPFGISIPWFYWAAIGLVLVITAISIYRLLKRSWDRKKLLEELSAHNTALSAFHQFNKDLRLLVRALHQQPSFASFLENLDKEFRLYLIRQFKVPALNWSNREILREIKRRHRLIDGESRQEIRRLFDELDRAKQHSQKINEWDCEQLAGIGRRLVEKLNGVSRGKS